MAVDNQVKVQKRCKPLSERTADVDNTRINNDNDNSFILILAELCFASREKGNLFVGFSENYFLYQKENQENRIPVSTPHKKIQYTGQLLSCMSISMKDNIDNHCLTVPIRFILVLLIQEEQYMHY